MMNSPHEVGEEASSLIGSRCREKKGWPTGKMVVVVVVVFILCILVNSVNCYYDY